MSRNLVIISKKWNHPKISMIVTDDEISFCVGLDDFREAVKQELGQVNGTDKLVDNAFERVVAGIKSESRQVMA